MLRTILLYLSTSRLARATVTHFYPAKRATRRFVAGETLAEAIAAARKLNDKNLLVSLDQLGENVHSKADAENALQEAMEILSAIKEAGIRANSSVKPTQLGLDLGDDFCLDTLRRLLTHARDLGLSVNVDMESSEYTERTLKIYRTLREEGFENVSVVIQSYLYRSEVDMKQLAEMGAAVRLCKGAYKEPPEVAFPEKADVDASFVKLAKAFMSAENRQRGAFLKIATHDLRIIEQAEAFIQENQVPPEQFEFQMLYGIRSNTQESLARKGYQVRVYVPYGTQWYPYFMRRLAERPANLWFIIRSILAR